MKDQTKSSFRNNVRGQALILGVLIVTVLIISVVAIVSIMQSSSHHQVDSQKRNKGRALAEAGISHAIQQLSASTTTWNRALAANFSGSDCNTGINVDLSSEEAFRIFCTTGPEANPGLEPYQVGVIAVSYMRHQNQTNVPTRAIKAYINQRTLGIDSASGIHEPAALQLVRRSSVTNNTPLTVHWGPIVCLDSGQGANAWLLRGTMRTEVHPRRYSMGGLTTDQPIFDKRAPIFSSGSYMTDNSSYWAFQPMLMPPLIDEAYYLKRATETISMTNAYWPTDGIAGPPLAPTDCGSGTPNCSYFVPSSSAVFSRAAPGYTVPSPGTVIWVDGDAQLDVVDMDGVTLIVTGDLTLGDSLSAGGSVKSATNALHVPRAASREYGLNSQITPCYTSLGGSCDSDATPIFPSLPVYTSGGGKVQFRGFMYVKGNLFVMGPRWNMAGAILVGDMRSMGDPGLLYVGPLGNLTLAYDDYIGQAIQVSPSAGTAIKVVIDRQFDIAVP